MSEIVPMSGTFVAPVIDVENALRAYQAMKDFVGKVLRDDVDFGVIPGTNKPTLLKPGAEKLCRFFGLSTHLNPLETIMDWTGEKHNGEPFFYFQYKVVALRNGVAVAEGVGSCSNWEKKYRYRNADLICPSCGKPNIRKSRQGDGWYCWAKTGGCGATFRGNDKQITDQPHGQIINPDPADLVNTIDKMAQKRAFIAAVLIACNASEYFTQDIEDYYVEGEFEDKPKKTEPKPETTPEAVKIDGKPIDISHSSTTQNVIQPEPPSNGGGARPLSPEALRDAITKKAEKCSDQVSAGARGLMVGQLCDLVDGDDNKRHQLTRYLTSVGSTKGMPGNICNALLDWMKDFDMAKREAAAVIVMLDKRDQPPML